MHSIKSAIILLLLLVVLAPVDAQEEDTSVSVRVWWPDTLASVRARALLSDVFATFAETQAISPRYYEYVAGDNVRVLELTNRVAPRAMPDLMLMRRDDMVDAVAAGLIVPIDGWAPATTIAGMPENLLTLGQVNGVLYGLPYLVEIKHIIYDTTVFETPPTAFDDVLDHEASMFFPGRPPNNEVVNDVVLMQYLAAGGTLVDAEANPVLDEEALETLLNSYAAGLDSGIFSPDLITYTSLDNYWSQVIASEIGLALIGSDQFLERQAGLPVEMGVTSVPTSGNQPIALLDGWVWVLMTNDVTYQEQAQRFLLWMMDTDRLVDLAEVLNTVPTQQRALRVLDDTYFDFVQDLLPRAVYVEERDNQAAAALQLAFEAVMNGGDPDEAAAAALESLSP